MRCRPSSGQALERCCEMSQVQSHVAARYEIYLWGRYSYESELGVSMNTILNALHYPVARARAHFYPCHDDVRTLFLEMIVRHSSPDARLLELGCGRYSYATPAREFCREVIGVEPSPSLRDNAWVNYR